MAALDILVIGVVGLSMLVGIMRGFMYEAAMLFGLVLAFFVARWLAPTISELFVDAIPATGLRMSAAFAVVAIAVLFANSILAFLLKSVFSKSALRPVDRLLGAVFGVVRACVILLIMALIVHILRMQEEPWWVDAKTAPALNGAVVIARPYMKSILNLDDETLSDGVQRLNEASSLLPEAPRVPEDGEKSGTVPDPADREKALLELLRNTQRQ